jgi:Tol biopolymer transport system component
LKTGCRGNGDLHSLWKDITIRAERIKYLPADDTDLKQLWVMNADGTNVRKLMGLLPEMTSLGSPEFSSDGKQIALDMSQGSVASSRVIVLNADGSSVRDLGRGCMPSFSPDGKKIAFTLSESGVMLMDADGTHREVVDRAGWSIQYSPDGKSLAYGKGGNIVLKDLKTGESRELLTGADAARYSYTYWNLAWSHDGKSVVFKGSLAEQPGFEVVLVDIADGSRTVLDSDAESVNPDFTFSQNSQSVLFSKNVPGKGARLHLVNRNSPGELKLLEGQPEDRVLSNCDWSDDGRLIAFTGRLEPKPVDWEPPKP